MSSADESTQTRREHRPLLYPAPLCLSAFLVPPAPLSSLSLPHITSPVASVPAFFFVTCSSPSLPRLRSVFHFSSSPRPPSHAVHLHPIVLCTTVVYQSPVSRWASRCPAPQSKQITVDILKGPGSNGPQWAGSVEAPFVQWLQHPSRHYHLSLVWPAKRTG